MAPIEASATGLILHQKALGQASQLAFQDVPGAEVHTIKNSKFRSDSTQIFPATHHGSM